MGEVKARVPATKDGLGIIITYTYLAHLVTYLDGEELPN